VTQDNSNRWYFIVIPILVALIPVISNIGTTIWLNSGINSIKKDIKSTENLKTKASLYHTLYPNVEVNLEPATLRYSFNIKKGELKKNEDIEKVNDELVDVFMVFDKKTTLNDVLDELKKFLEEYGIEQADIGNFEDLIVFDIRYCVLNSGEFTQSIHTPKIYIANRPKNEIDSYQFNELELVPQNNPISTLVPKQKACNVAKAKLGKELFQKIKNIPNNQLNLPYKFELKVEPQMKALKFLYENNEEAESAKEELTFYYIEVNSSSLL